MRCRDIAFVPPLVLALLALFVGNRDARAAEDVRLDRPTFLISADRLYQGDGTVTTDVMVLVRDGRIAAIGNKVAMPRDAIQLRTPALMPGLIDIHSHLCMDTRVVSSGEATSAPANRMIDAWNPDCPWRDVALAGGVTTIVYRPGSSAVLEASGGL